MKKYIKEYEDYDEFDTQMNYYDELINNKALNSQLNSIISKYKAFFKKIDADYKKKYGPNALENIRENVSQHVFDIKQNGEATIVDLIIDEYLDS